MIFIKESLQTCPKMFRLKTQTNVPSNLQVREKILSMELYHCDGV